MTQLVQQVLDRRKELDEKTSAIRRKLQTYPDGKLICTRNGRYIKWYHSDGRIQTYIPKKKREYAEQLAEKKYWTLRLNELVREQKATEAYLRHYGVELLSSTADSSELFLTDSPGIRRTSYRHSARQFTDYSGMVKLPLSTKRKISGTADSQDSRRNLRTVKIRIINCIAAAYAWNPISV